AAALALVGALDLASWWLLETFASDRAWLWGGLGFGGVAVLTLRALANPLQQLVTQAAQAGSIGRDWAPRLLDIAGTLGGAVLLLAWLVLVQWLVFAPAPLDALEPFPAWLRWSLLA